MKGALLFGLTLSCFGATTQTWEMNGYQDFSRGRMAGLSLTRDGKLTPGPAVTTLFDSGQPEIWSVAQAPDGSFYVGTGNRGRLFQVDASGRGTLLWTADQPEIFAVAVDLKGVVYAASSPDGKIVRVENGKVTDYFNPGARYIWGLAVAPDGALLVATGDEGKIFRVTGPEQGSVYFETGQAHVTSLAFDAQGRLLAGSEPNGILYRVTAPGKAFVLYNAKFPEIRAIVPTPDGSIYAAALGGGVARRVSAASAASTATSGSNLPTISTTVTVTADQQGGVTPAPKPEPPKLAAPAASTTVVAPAATSDSSGGDRSALFKISPDNTVETLWTSKDENVYDLALQGSSVVFLTDSQGRLYRLEGNGKTTLMAQAGEGDATRLLASPRGLIAATGNLGKLLRLDSGGSSSGWFESPVHDSGTVARWGRMSWRGDANSAVLRTRTGNSARPDTTWSDWSAPLASSGAAIASPNARYIQWRAEFTGASGGIDNVTIPYLPQNTPPVIRSITVAGAPAPATPKATPTTGTTSSYSVTVTDMADSSGTASQTISHGAGQQVQIAWLAEDPDGDRLIYNLYFRSEEESEWKLLHGNTTDNYYTLESDVLSDGRYFFRVTASDRLSNAASVAREAEMVSSPVVVDNAPPVVTAGAPRRSGTTWEVAVDAVDRGSVLRRCEYSVDAGPWFPVEAADGVTDSSQEQFPIHIENLAAGEHLISIRVYDAVGNAGLTKVVAR